MVRKNITDSTKNSAVADISGQFFFGREDLIASFFEVYNQFASSIHDVSYNPCVLSFYGIGGIGKTSLIREINGKMDSILGDCAYYANIDLETDAFDSETFLRRMYGQLSEKYGFQFPLYEFARYTLNRKLGEKSKKTESNGIPQWLKKRSVLGQLLALCGDVPGVGAIGVILKLAERGVAVAQNLFEMYKSDLQTIEQADSQQLAENLHIFFRKDMEEIMKTMKFPLVVFVDTFEKSEGKNDNWLRGVSGVCENIEALVYQPKTMFVIAGRNEMFWARQDDGWNGLLKQIPVGQLSRKNAEEWFEKYNVQEHSLRDSLYELTEGVPLYLNVCLLHYKKLLQQGCIPESCDFGSSKKELVNRYFRNLEENEQRSLFALAMMRSWISPMVEYVGENLGRDFNIYLVVDYEENLRFNSFIVHAAEGISYIHNIVGSCVIESANHQYLKEPVQKNAVSFQNEFLKKEPVTSELYTWAVKWLMEFCVNETKNAKELESFYVGNVFEKLKALCEYARFDSLFDVYGLLQNSAKVKDNPTLLALANKDAAIWLRGMGRYNEALVNSTEAVSLYERSLNLNDPRLLRAQREKAICLLKFAKYQEAQSMCEDLLQKRISLYGEDNSETLESLNDLKTVYMSAEMGEKSLLVCEKILDVTNQIFGINSLESFYAQNNVANVYNAMHMFPKAHDIQQKLVETCKRVAGEDCEVSVNMMDSLAKILANYDQLNESLELRKSVFEKRKKLYGDGHPMTLESMKSIALCLKMMGSLIDAEKIQKDLLEICRGTFGSMHPRTIEVVKDYCDTLNYLKKYDLAVEMGLQNFETASNFLGEMHPLIFDISEILASSYEKMGLPEKAIDIRLDLADKSDALYGRVNSITLDTKSALGETYENMGDYDSALKLRKLIIPLYEEKYGLDNTETILQMNELGMDLFYLERFGEGLSLIKDIENRIESNGEVPLMTVVSIDMTKTLLLSGANLPKESLELGEKILKISIENFSDFEWHRAACLFCLAHAQYCSGLYHSALDNARFSRDVFREFFGDYNILYQQSKKIISKIECALNKGTNNG